MYLTMRWFGPQDPVTLEHIRQVPAVRGIVTALHDHPPGEVWPREEVEARRRAIERMGLVWAVAESLPVHEDIKLGSPSRNRYIDHYIKSLHHLAASGVRVVCYNFMPAFDWIRTNLAYALSDGSSSLAYDEAQLASVDEAVGRYVLPGWAAASGTTHSDASQVLTWIRRFQELSADDLWSHLAYFLKAVLPEAEKLGIRLVIHPDDPPWPVFGMPRIVGDEAALERLLDIDASPANGLCLCVGSLGARPDNDVLGLVNRFVGAGRVHFVHLRNIRRTGWRQFHETGHRDGSLPMARIVAALYAHGYDGPVRPDHGRQIWGEGGQPGYGLFDRSLGAMYLAGLWEGVEAARG